MKLTNKQQRVFDYYKSYISKHRIAPTYTIASKDLNLSSSVVFAHIKTLAKKGYLVASKRGGNSVQLAINSNNSQELLFVITNALKDLKLQINTMEVLIKNINKT